jgi:hypothetical protein
LCRNKSHEETIHDKWQVSYCSLFLKFIQRCYQYLTLDVSWSGCDLIFVTILSYACKYLTKKHEKPRNRVPSAYNSAMLPLEPLCSVHALLTANLRAHLSWKHFLIYSTFIDTWMWKNSRNTSCHFVQDILCSSLFKNVNLYCLHPVVWQLGVLFWPSTQQFINRYTNIKVLTFLYYCYVPLHVSTSYTVYIENILTEYVH